MKLRIQRLCKKSLSLYKFYTAVLGAASFAAVVGNRLVASLAHGAEVERIHAFLLQSRYDGLCALLAQRIVHCVGALVVGMALNLEAGAGVLLHILRNLLDLLH